ncbi:hypothetical protein ACU4GD_09980 [Cupriavidus basilensis]
MVWRRAFGCFLHQVDAVEHDALIRVQAHGRFDALCAPCWWMRTRRRGIEARAGGYCSASWLGNALVANVADIKNVYDDSPIQP